MKPSYISCSRGVGQGAVQGDIRVTKWGQVRSLLRFHNSMLPLFLANVDEVAILVARNISQILEVQFHTYNRTISVRYELVSSTEKLEACRPISTPFLRGRN